ncbi:hypothetical protein KI387_034423, partial [Taxus chinensis]
TGLRWKRWNMGRVYTWELSLKETCVIFLVLDDRKNTLNLAKDEVNILGKGGIFLHDKSKVRQFFGFRRLRGESEKDGHMQFYSFADKTGKSVTDYLTDSTDALNVCDYPTPCGDYGICTDGQCSCPKKANAFDQIDVSKPNSGCLPHSPLVCPETKIMSFW